MTDTTSALEVFESGLSKSDIKQIVNNTIETIGEQGNALKVAEALSAMESFVKEMKADKRFTDQARDEAQQYPKGYVSASGAKIECIEAGTKYDYSQCNDTIFESLSQQKQSIDEQLKARETFLKTISIEGLEIADSNTGEIVKIFPPSKSSTSTYKVTLSAK